MSKEFILTTDELFGSYCYIEQKRYGVPNEKFLYKIIGKFTSNAWSNVPVDVNDKEPHIFNHSEEVVNVVCCGVCEDKIERYKLSDVEIISNKDQQLADLEAKLAESEKLTERLQQIVDKLRDKEFAGKTLVEAVNAVYEPLYKNKYDEAEELKKQLQEKEKYTYTGKEVGEIERKYDEKIDTLEQQLKSQPAEIVEKIKEFVDGNAYYYEEEQYAKQIDKYLDEILKEYQK